MLKLSCQIILVCIFSMKLSAGDEYNFSDLDFSDFAPSNLFAIDNLQSRFYNDAFDPSNILWNEEIRDESPAPNYVNNRHDGEQYSQFSGPTVVVNNNFMCPMYPPYNDYLPGCNFAGPVTIQINNYFIQPDPSIQNFPAMPIPMPINFGLVEKPEPENNKRKAVVKYEAVIKRPKTDETLNSEPIQKIIYNGPSKEPIIRAFLAGIQNDQGGNYINQREGLISIYDLDELLEYIYENTDKKQPTTDINNRIKTLRRWFEGFPRKPMGKTFELALRETMQERYQALFDYY